MAKKIYRNGTTNAVIIEDTLTGVVDFAFGSADYIVQNVGGKVMIQSQDGRTFAKTYLLSELEKPTGGFYASVSEAVSTIGGLLAAPQGATSLDVTLQGVNKTIRVLNSTLATVDGVTIGGAYSICLTTSSDFAGTINGVTRQPSSVLSIEADVMGLIPSFAYTITAGSIIIDTLA